MQGLINQIDNPRLPAPQEPPAQTALTAPQIQDVVNREVERQSQILNLRPVNLDAFRYDMEQALQNTRPDDMLNALEELHVNYVNAREEALASAVSTVLNDLARLNNNAQRQAPQGVPPRSTAAMNAASDITQTLYTEARDNNFEMRDLTSTLHALDAGNFDHPMIRELPEADRAAVQQDIAASMRLLLENQNIDIPFNIFADGIPGAAPVAGNGPEAYREQYTNELTGSRRAFDEVMQAERMSPGSIYTAIDRTDGDARSNQEIMDFYRVDSPMGVMQLNRALREYMTGNGFDVPPAPRAIDQLEARYPANEAVVVEPEAALTGALDAAREFHSDFVVDEVQDLVDNIQNDDIRFDREPDRFIEQLRDEADQYTTLNQTYSDAVNEVIRFLENYMRERRQRPQGRKRGGYIKKKMMKNGGEYNLPDLGEPEEEPKNIKPFNPPAIPYSYSGVSGARMNRAIPIDRESAVSLSADVSRRQDQGGTNYNINEMGGGYHHKVGPGMLGVSGSHRMGTKENRVNLMYAIPMNEGGKVEPTSPSPSVNDQSKPVIPVKPIHNPDAPEFKEIFNRERAIRGGTQSGGPSADLKQMMNPRNITYNAGGKVSVDEMRYELLRKQ